MREKLYDIFLVIEWILVVVNVIFSVIDYVQKFYDQATYHLVLSFGLAGFLAIVMFIHVKDETEDNHSN